jgi:hypothetical protein
MSTSDFSPGHRALPRIFANPKESQLAEITQLLFQSGSEVRKSPRIIPASPHSTLILADGTTHGCFVIDMSVSGVAVSAQVQPPIGMPLAVGACIGRVVRALPDGFAIKFVEPQNRRDLDRLIARPTPSPSAGGAKATRPLDDAAVVPDAA